MSESDDKLLRRYRELSRDEPPAAIDAAILAASRRAVGSRPWSRRFAGPVSIAAVLVLAVGVTLNMQREDPGIETALPEKPVPAAPASVADASRSDAAGAPAAQAPAATDAFKADALARQAKPAKAPKAYADRKLKEEVEAPPASVAPQQLPSVSAAPQESRPEPRAFAAAPSSAAAPAPSAQAPERFPLAKSAASREKREASDANVVAGKLREDIALADPVAELERIARLRTEGRHEEADKAIEEFVRKNPAYRIPDPVWDRVRRR